MTIGNPKLILNAKGDAALYQRLMVFLTTVKGTVPLDREYGISNDILDGPIPLVSAKLRAEIYIQLKNRFDIVPESITFDFEDDILYPKVVINR